MNKEQFEAMNPVMATKSSVDEIKTELKWMRAQIGILCNKTIGIYDFEKDQLGKEKTYSFADALEALKDGQSIVRVDDINHYFIEHKMLKMWNGIDNQKRIFANLEECFSKEDVFANDWLILER